MFIIRWILGRLILAIDFITSPKAPKRSAQEQTEIDEKTQHLELYQLPACPFCVKVRRAIKRDGLTIALRNINQNENLREELIKEGGKRTVPCLKISQPEQPVKWMYESSEIITYLQQYSKAS